jgi:adenylosuccinate lyase
MASSLDKYSLEIRNLQRTEVLELEEPFHKGQKGSSAMPHKRNPVICERICGLARVLRANALAAMEDMVLWHERDITHSSVERIIIPDSTTLLHYMLEKFTGVIENITIYPDNMAKNMEKSKGRFFSQRVMLALTEKGMKREEAYRLVQAQAMKSWQTGEDFRKLVRQDKNIRRLLKQKDMERCFDLKASLANTQFIFRRLGI